MINIDTGLFAFARTYSYTPVSTDYGDISFYEVTTEPSHVASNWYIYSQYGSTSSNKSIIEVDNATLNGSFTTSIRYYLEDNYTKSSLALPVNSHFADNSAIKWVNNYTSHRNNSINVSFNGVDVNFKTDFLTKHYGNAVFTIPDGQVWKSNTTLDFTWTGVNSYGGSLGDRKVSITSTKDYHAGDMFQIGYNIKDFQARNVSITVNTVPDTPPVVKHNITWDLQNATVTPNDSVVDAGEHTFNFKADDGFIFNEVGGVNGGSEIQPSNSDTASLTYDIQSDVTIKLHANRPPVVTIPVTVKGEHITNYPSTVSVDSDSIVLTAESGYVFSDETTTTFYAGSDFNSVITTPPSNTDTLTIQLTTLTSAITGITIDTNVTKPDTPSGGYLHSYRVTTSQLNALSTELAWNEIPNAGQGNYYDVTKYYDNLIKFPFVVSADTTNNYITLGKAESTVIAREYNKDTYDYDMGSIKVTPNYNNGYDYQVTSVELLLPYVDTISLDISNVMNHTVSLIYRISISSGNTTVLIYSDSKLIRTVNASLAKRIPFYTTFKNYVINANTFMFDNSIFTPQISITQHEPDTAVEWYENNIISKGSELDAGSYQGYLSNVQNINRDDLIKLNEILYNGFII